MTARFTMTMCHIALIRHIVSRTAILALSLLIVSLGWLAPPSLAIAQTAELKIGGTGAGLGVMKKLADAFRRTHPEARIKIMPSLGSTGGIQAVTAGVLGIGVTSRPLSESEKALGLKEREICLNPFVIATSVKTPVKNLTFSELEAIYRGEKKTWSNGIPIRPILRPARDTDMTMLKTMAPGLELAVEAAQSKDGMNVALTDTDAADVIEKVPGAIGTSSLALIISEKRRLKPVALNGITPSVQSLENKRYPYYKPLYLVTGPNPAPVAQQFVQFAASPAGIRILKANGTLVPL